MHVIYSLYARIKVREGKRSKIERRNDDADDGNGGDGGS